VKKYRRYGNGDNQQQDSNHNVSQVPTTSETWKDTSSTSEDGDNIHEDDQISLSTYDPTEQASSIGSLTPLNDFFYSWTLERLQSSNKGYHYHPTTIEDNCLKKQQQQFWNSQETTTINHKYNSTTAATVVADNIITDNNNTELINSNLDILSSPSTTTNTEAEKVNLRKSKTSDISSMWGWFVWTDDK